MNNSKKELLAYLENISLFLLGITLLAYPLLFSTLTTDVFTLPKQILLGVGVIASVVVLSVRMIIEGRVRLRTTPFDLPIIVFMIVAFASAMLSVNRADALINFVPVLFAGFFFFTMTNIIRGKRALLFSVGSFLLGTTAAALLSLLSFFKIYIVPIAGANVQSFTTFGSLLDQAVFLAISLPLAGYMAWPIISPLLSRTSDLDVFETGKKNNAFFSIFATAASALLLAGLLTTIYMLATTQRPLILPLMTGFQTALAAISQDTGRVLQAFIFGSGYGTYLNDFTRFKQAAYNTNASLWSFTFFRSSNLFLELLATTGIAGLASFVFIVYRVVKEKSFFLPIVLTIIAAVLLPFSFTLIALFFIILGFFAALRAVHAPSRFGDLEFYLVTLKHGLILAQPEGERAPHDPVNTRYGKILPFFFIAVIIGLVGYTSYHSLAFVRSDMTFQKSLVAASANKVQDTYDLQNKAIQQFPNRDTYHRIFGQTNLAIANALASSQPQGSSPSAEIQQQIVTLIQQSITSSRNAVTISPQTSMNWDNLSSIYRSLIGFGQNADQFAILANQQAITLDPSNPQEYINLGGIYYQLGQWDDAIRQFQLAANLKRDYANAYYNLGHALESKGGTENLQGALQAYKIVEQLVSSDAENVKRIKAEIDTVTKKIAGGQQAQADQSADQTAQSDLNVNDAPTLPGRDPKVEVEGPPTSKISPTPTPTKAQEPTPSL